MAVAERTVAQDLAAQLAAAGVRHVYGFPGGGSNLDLIDSLRREGIEFVLTRTEGGAGFMACAAAERTGAPGVMVVGNGPGLASAVNGVAHAHLDRVPLLVISDRYTDAELATSGHQILEQRAMLEPLVRWSATVEPATASSVITEAIARSLQAPFGPVHLDMPRDVAAKQLDPSAPAATVASPDRPAAASTASPDLATGATAASPDHPTGASPAASPDLSATVSPAPPERDTPAAASNGSPSASASPDLAVSVPDALRTAERPALVLGLECNAPEVEQADIVALADALGAAVLTTYKAKGAFPEDDPRWAGIVTGGEIERDVLDAADAIVCVGVDPVELLTRPWPFAAPVLNLRACDTEAGYLPIDRVLPIGAAVRGLASTLATERTAAAWSPDEIKRLRTESMDSLRIVPPSGMAGWQVVETVREATPAGATLAVDAGAHMFAAVEFWRTPAHRSFLISNGLATMGFALPSAIGAAQVDPSAHAIAITGDGGMAYNAFELATAAAQNLPVIVVVLNDSSLSLIRVKHEAKGNPRADLDLPPVSFAEIATGLGAAAASVNDAPSLTTAIAQALTHQGPTVIDVAVTGAEHREMLTTIRG
jgi:acetolactate synthase I/II/III large subunit